jgi:hypothetical protein
MKKRLTAVTVSQSLPSCFGSDVGITLDGLGCMAKAKARRRLSAEEGVHSCYGPIGSSEVVKSNETVGFGGL